MLAERLLRWHGKSKMLVAARTCENNNMPRPPSLLSELRAVQKRHGDFESLDLLIPDLSGILKGKRIRRGDFEKSCKGGFVFCAGATLLTGLGDVVSGSYRLGHHTLL